MAWRQASCTVQDIMRDPVMASVSSSECLLLKRLLNQSSTCLQVAIIAILAYLGILALTVGIQDGFTYERSAIEEWICKEGRSPMTNAPLGNRDLQPNLLIKQMINALYSK